MPASSVAEPSAAGVSLTQGATGAEVEYADVDDGGIDEVGGIDSGPEAEPTTPSAPADTGRVRDASGRFTSKSAEPAAIAESPSAPQPVIKTELEADDAFDAALLSQAEHDYGFSADEAREFGSPELLKKAMAWHDRRAAAWGLAQLEALEAARHEPTRQPAQQPAQQQPPPPAPAQQPAPATFQKYKVELDPEVYDEDTIKVFNGLNNHYHQRLVEQDEVLQAVLQAVLSHHESLNQVTGQSQADEEARIERDMDTWIAKLGDEWATEFGKGSVRDLPADSPQLANRQKIAKQMRGLAYTAAQEGKRAPDLEQLANRALGALYYQQIQERARKQLATQVGSRRAQSIARPAGRNGKPQSPDEAAKQFVRKYMQQFDAVEDDDEDEGL